MIPVETPTTSSSPASTSTTTTSASSPNNNHTEYCVIIIGHHKQPLYEKILHSAVKFEHHIQYHDLVYLTFDVDGVEITVELNDPGTEHTGAREMAIRKADAVILCYSAHDPDSFHKLANIVDDFKSRKNGHFPPVFLICNEDKILNEEFDGETKGNNTNADNASISEGYGSSGSPEAAEDRMSRASTPTDECQSRRRRPSMDQIREAHEENCLITKEQGENLAKLLEPDCEFLQISYSQFADAAQFMQKLIVKTKASLAEDRNGVRDKSRTRSRRRSPLISLRHTQSLKKFLDKANDKKKRLSARFNHSSSDEEAEEAADESPETESPDKSPNHPTKKCSGNFVGNAFRAIKASSPRGRSKSQKQSPFEEPLSPSLFSPPPLTMISPPTGEPSLEPFSFDPALVEFVLQREMPLVDSNGVPLEQQEDPLAQKRLSQLSVSSSKSSSSKNGKSQQHHSTTCVIS